MRIPMIDLAGQYRDLKAQIEPAMAATLNAAQYILGPNVQAFEAEAAKYLGVKHAITCANGTDALHLALLAAGIGPGDEVITTPFTFIATAEAIAYVGAKAVFVDIDPQTLNIDVAQVAQAITPKTKALLPVHLFGQPANIQPLLDLAGQHGLQLIEDCAQSFGESDPLYSEIVDFVDSIRQQRQPKVTGRAGRRALEAVQRITEATRLIS